VEDVAAVMQGHQIDRAHVVGFSMGGDAAPQFGLRIRKRLARFSQSPRDPVLILPSATPVSAK
jgi:pimeloyl-ACP methyl ester carboxylesterase